MIIHHKLKCWPLYFKAILTGRKNFECRKNDRNFHAGEKLILQEYDPHHHGDPYTGNVIDALILDIWDFMPGLPDDFVIMQIKVLNVRYDAELKG